MAAHGAYAPFVLHGVTGSGKTEVYLRAIERVVARGEQALVLVPEISLTPQLVERFATRFGAPLAVLHSGLGDAERLQAWRAARSGTAPVVIGTRSAVFAPMARPGLIVVDEEHDASYKQQDGFHYSARDLALARGQRHGVPVVLGSATPSLESLQRVRAGRAKMLELPNRTGGARPPVLQLVDLRRHASTQGIATPNRTCHTPASWRRWPGPAVPEPPRLCADVVLSDLRLGRAVSALRRATDGAFARAHARMPPLRHRAGDSAAVSRLWRGSEACRARH